MKIAFIGTGRIAWDHLRGMVEWNRVAPSGDTLEISALIDLVPGRARQFWTDHGADSALPEPALIGDDYRAVLAGPHRPDFVSILLPHHLHLEVGGVFLEAGIPVQMQKPLGLALRDGRALIDLSRLHGTPLVVSEPSVLGRKHRQLIAWVRSGQIIGEPTLLIDQAVIDLRGGFFMTPWRHLKGMAGAGWFIDHGVHRTHWMLEAFGPCDEAFAYTRQLEPTRTQAGWGEVAVDTEDLAGALLRFRSGVIVQWTVMSGGRGAGLWQVRLYGSKGSLEGETVHLSGHAQPQPLEFAASPEMESVPENPFAHSYQELIARRRAPDAPVVASAERALEAQAIVYACLESAHTGKPVRIDDILAGRLHAYEDTVWEARDRVAAMDITRLT